jgi:predicted XRE-type DNA-binding protein
MKSYSEAKNAKELCKLMGLPQSQAHKIEMRTRLVVAIKHAIEKQHLTHAQAAEKADVGRTVITAIVNGNLHRISTDRLIDVAQNLDLKVQLKVV